MPNLIIDGNTYKNIDTIHLKQTDGSIAAFRQWSGSAEQGPLKISTAGLVTKVPAINIANTKNFTVSIKEGK